MPLLSRKVKQLLHSLPGRNNEGSNHGGDAASTDKRPLDKNIISIEDEDYNRDPDSSSDEGSEQAPMALDGTNDAVSSAAKSKLGPLDESPPAKATNNPRGSRSKIGKKEAKTGDKRKSDGTPASNIAVPDPEEDIFNIFAPRSQTSSSQRQYKSYRSTPTSNIHSSQNKKKSPGHLEPTKFKKRGTPTSSNPKPERRAFKEPKQALAETTSNSKANAFKQPTVQDHSPENPLSPSQSPAKRFKIDLISSPLSTPPGSSDIPEPEAPDSSAPIILNDDQSVPARCPICDEEVDREFLESFNKGKKLRWKDKMDFCTAHKQQTAAETWTHKQYPKINWEKLERRLRKYHKPLTAIIEGRQTSYYRNRLEEQVDSGKDRNVLKNPELADSETIVPGYYGHKGSRIMMDHLMAQFSTKIRKVATKDRLMPQIGVSSFVQAVLVPELAVLLVMEDLKVDKEQARVVLKESAEVGDLMNAEEEDRLEYVEDPNIL